MQGTKYTSKGEKDYILPDSGKLHANIAEIKNRFKGYEEKTKSKYLIFPIFGLIVAIFLVFATADFKATFGIPGETWQAFFLFVLVFLGGSLIYYVVKWFPNRKLDADKFINDILQECFVKE